MKTPRYESSAGALETYLAGKPQAGAYWDLYTFNLVGSLNGGDPLLYTTCDVDITVLLLQHRLPTPRRIRSSTSSRTNPTAIGRSELMSMRGK